MLFKIRYYCNATKSDILPSELGLDIDIDDAYALAREVSPRMKEVKQLTKDGKLINIYESTAEAGRQTGNKGKGNTELCDRRAINYFQNSNRVPLRRR